MCKKQYGNEQVCRKWDVEMNRCVERGIVTRCVERGSKWNGNGKWSEPESVALVLDKEIIYKVHVAKRVMKSTLSRLVTLSSWYSW